MADYNLNSTRCSGSQFLTDCTDVKNSIVCFQSNNLLKSSFIYNSSYTTDCIRISNSTVIRNSDSIINSNFINASAHVRNSQYIYDSKCIDNSTMLNDSYFCSDCHNSNHLIACSGLKMESYKIFNQPVSKDLFDLVLAFLNEYENGLAWSLANFPYEHDIAEALAPLPSYINPTHIDEELVSFFKTLPMYDNFIMYQITNERSFLNI